MPRGEKRLGFDIADVAADLTDDLKVKALWRSCDTVEEMNLALVLYEETVRRSWQQGRRVKVKDVVPFWLDSTPIDRAILNLRRSRLLDGKGCIPAKAWESWFGPARDRREQNRANGALGGRPPKSNKPDGNPSLTQRKPIVNPSNGKVRKGNEPLSIDTQSLRMHEGPEKLASTAVWQELGEQFGSGRKS